MCVDQGVSFPIPCSPVSSCLSGGSQHVHIFEVLACVTLVRVVLEMEPRTVPVRGRAACPLKARGGPGGGGQGTTGRWVVGWTPTAALCPRLRGQQLDRGRHAGEEAAAAAPDTGPGRLPQSPKEQVPVRFRPHHRLSTGPFLTLPPSDPAPSLPPLLLGPGGQRKGGARHPTG